MADPKRTLNVAAEGRSAMASPHVLPVTVAAESRVGEVTQEARISVIAPVAGTLVIPAGA